MDSVELLDLCKKIVKDKKPVSIYKKLIPIFDDVGLEYESVSNLKKIWHITNDMKYLIQAGDMYLNSADDAHEAYMSYDLFFQRTNPDFYMRYKYALNKKGYSEMSAEIDMYNYKSPIVILLDKYNTIGQIMTYFYQYKKFDEIFKAKEYLIYIQEQIKSYGESHPKEEYPWEEELKNFNKYLSGVLSKTEHNNIINYFSIELDPENEQAYLNIIDDYIVENNYEKAQEVYKKYCKQFKKDYKETIPDMFWELSNVCRDKNMFYKAVFYQKCVIEYELNLRGEK